MTTTDTAIRTAHFVRYEPHQLTFNQFVRHQQINGDRNVFHAYALKHGYDADQTLGLATWLDIYAGYVGWCAVLEERTEPQMRDARDLRETQRSALV